MVSIIVNKKYNNNFGKKDNYNVMINHIRVSLANALLRSIHCKYTFFIIKTIF